MRVRQASRSRLLAVLCVSFVAAALWVAPRATAQVSIPDPDDVSSQVDDLEDRVKDTVDEAEGTVKDITEDPAGAVKETVDGAGGTIEGATSGTSSSAEEQATTSSGTSASGQAKSDGKKNDGDGPRDRRRGKKSATKADDVDDLVSGGNEISGTEVAGTRIQAGDDEGETGAMSLTGAALLALLVIGAAHIAVGMLLAGWVRQRRRSNLGQPIEGSGR